ncbi:MAG: TldD/PmbA family protein [Candidatus Margulisbacteria bacterium]|nr:TldD/PmbA family protein [Candidatus Margulisiibacteriota bacterium]
MNSEIKEFFDFTEKELNKHSFDNWDVYLVSEQDRHISCRGKQVEDFKENTETGCAVRVLKDQKMSLVYTNDLEKDSISRAADKAKFILNYMMPDEFFKINADIPAGKSAGDKLDLSYFDLSISEKIKRLLYLEEKIFAQHKTITNIEHLVYAESYNQLFYKTKFSSILEDKSVHFGYSGDVIAEDAGQAEAGSYADYKNKLAAIDLDRLAYNIAHQAYSMLNAKSVQSGYYPVIFRNDAMALFLSTFVELFSADRVQNNKSVLAGKMGERIAGESLFMVDDATLPDSLGSYLFDGEGTPAAKKTLVEKGVLKNYLYDLKTAAKEKTKSTGNALRSSYQGSPQISPSNFIIDKGPYSYEDLWKKQDNELIIISGIMGMHTANTINGDFSVGASGYKVKNGEITGAVKQFTIAGNFLQLLQRVVKIGNDEDNFPYHGNIITPSLYFSDISISGL